MRNGILERFGHGDKEAFASLYRQYAPKMRLFAGGLTHDRQLTEDIVHNVFLKLWENREIVCKVESIDKYLFRATKNAVFDVYEHNIIVARYEYRQSRSESFAFLNMDDQINADDLAMMIDLAIDMLPPQRQKIFRMSRYSGYSNNEIAEKLGLSVNTVNNHISLAMKDLKEALADFIA